MMDYDKLIERLHKEAYGSDIEELLLEAATALSTLQAENEKLRNEVERQRRSADDRKHLYENAERAYMKVVAELEQVKRERDAAVECINTVYSYILTKSKTDAVRTIEKWRRGPQKED